MANTINRLKLATIRHYLANPFAHVHMHVLIGAVFEACYNELAVCWKCTANDLNFSGFELNCSADEDRTLTVVQRCQWGH